MFPNDRKEIVSICRRLIGDTSRMCRSRSPTVAIIWKPGLSVGKDLLNHNVWFIFRKVKPSMVFISTHA